MPEYRAGVARVAGREPARGPAAALAGTLRVVPKMPMVRTPSQTHARERAPRIPAAHPAAVPDVLPSSCLMSSQARGTRQVARRVVQRLCGLRAARVGTNPIVTLEKQRLNMIVNLV